MDSDQDSALSFGAAFILTLSACHSSQVRIPGDPVGPNERSTGAVEPCSKGFMLFNVIPINQNDRFRRHMGLRLLSRELPD